MSDAYNSAYEQVRTAILSYFIGDSKELLRLELNFRKRWRNLIFELLKTLPLLWSTVKLESGIVINVIRSSVPNAYQLTSGDVKARDDLTVHYYEKYFNVGLPVIDFRTVEYYLDVLNPYKGCNKTYRGFCEDVYRFNGVMNLRAHIKQVTESIKDYLNGRLDDFKMKAFEEEFKFSEHSSYKTQKSFYTSSNAGQSFVSIDITQADFTVVNHFCPGVFKGFSKWEDFVHSFDNRNSYTLMNSKLIRNRVFGQLRLTGRIQKLSEYLIKEFATTQKLNESDVVMLNGDEIVLKNSNENFWSIFIRGGIPNWLKMTQFHLRQLKPYDYFVKEHFTDLDPGHVCKKEFKCIPNKRLIESIKHYEGKKVTEIDLRFKDDDGRIAVYERFLQWES
jgi:hypothetical protein